MHATEALRLGICDHPHVYLVGVYTGCVTLMSVMLVSALLCVTLVSVLLVSTLLCVSLVSLVLVSILAV